MVRIRNVYADGVSMKMIEVKTTRTFQNENFGDIFWCPRHAHTYRKPAANLQSLSGNLMGLIPGLAAYARHPYIYTCWRKLNA